MHITKLIKVEPARVKFCIALIMETSMFFNIFCYIMSMNVVLADAGSTCPNQTFLNEFNETKFEGIWYEIRRLGNTLIDKDCGESIYKWESGEFSVTYKLRDTTANVSNKIEMILKPSEPKIPGAYDVFIDSTKEPIPHIVLNTDYTSYSIVWGCKADGDNKTQRLFIYSRNTTLSENSNTTIQETLKQLQIKDEDLIEVEQDFMKCNRNYAARLFPAIGIALLMYFISKYI